MTTHTISSGYPAGYAMSATTLTVTSTGSIGGSGLIASATATVVNYGVILATNGGANGVLLAAGGILTNGNAGGYAESLIAGAIGVETASGSAPATLINYGTIDGTSGTAVNFQSQNDVLVAEAGSEIVGVVHAYASLDTLRLGSGAGAGVISGLGAAFQGFSAYQVDPGAAWTLAGANQIKAGTLSVLGSLTIAGTLQSQASIGVSGDLSVSGSLINAGSISGTITMYGGALTNQAGGVLSSGGVVLDGAAGGGAGTVLNLGVITSTSNAYADVVLGSQGGVLINAAAGASAALITGYVGVDLTANDTLINYGVIRGAGGTAVYSGSATNVVVVEAGAVFGGAVSGGGGTLELGANAGAGTLSGLGSQFTGFGVVEIDAGGDWSFGAANTLATFGTVLNYGTLHAAKGYAVVLSAGGVITNGAATNPTAMIEGGAGVAFTAAGTLANFGTVVGRSLDGVQLSDGGTVRNGGVTDTGARIVGAVNGVVIGGGAGAVANFGTVSGDGGDGALLAGGSFANGASTDRGALTEGYVGVAETAAGAITNFATIAGVGGAGDYGVELTAGGTLVNGAVNVANALVEGYGGVLLGGGAKATNFGTVWGEGLTGPAASLYGGAILTNGAAGHGGATIVGYLGVSAGSGQAATVVNFGTIEGTGGVAVQFSASSDRLIAESGSIWLGAVQGGGGTLELGAGSGTLANLGAGAVSVTGAQALTTKGFGSYQLDTGGSWTLAGSATLGAGQTLTDFATIIGALALGSANDRLVLGTGAFIGGAITGGGGALELASGSGTISGLGGAGTILGGVAASFSGFGAYAMDAGSSWTLAGANTLTTGQSLTDGGVLTVAGTLGGAGTLAVAGGSAVIAAGATITVSHWALTGGAVSVDETLSYAGAFTQSAGATLTMAAADKLTLSKASTLGGTVNGGGTVAVADATLSGLTIGGTTIFSVTGTADQTGTVTVGDGSASAATLNVAKGAAYTLSGPVGIAVGTATSSQLKVAGTLVRSGATGTGVISVKTVDTGSIVAGAGKLDFAAALSGSGTMTVDAGATLEADSAVAASLTATFAGPGTLALKASATFAATIAGFAAGDTIDLINKKATSATLGAGDTLVIANAAGTIATLQLTGTYTGDTFTTKADGHGGTDVTISSGAGPAPPTPQALPFIAAMAALGADAAAAHIPAAHAGAWRPILLAPRVQSA